MIEFLRQAHSPKLYILMGSAALVFVVVVVATVVVVDYCCPRSQRILYLRDTHTSKIKQALSTPEALPLIVDKIVSKNCRVDPQRSETLCCASFYTVVHNTWTSVSDCNPG